MLGREQINAVFIRVQCCASRYFECEKEMIPIPLRGCFRDSSLPLCLYIFAKHFCVCSDILDDGSAQYRRDDAAGTWGLKAVGVGREKLSAFPSGDEECFYRKAGLRSGGAEDQGIFTGPAVSHAKPSQERRQREPAHPRETTKGAFPRETTKRETTNDLRSIL